MAVQPAELTLAQLRGLRKEDCPCCVASRDPLGRMRIGLGGADCLMRLRRNALVAEARHLRRRLDEGR